MKGLKKNTALRKKCHIKSLKKPNGHMKTREKVGHMKNLENKNYGSIKSLIENYGNKSLFKNYSYKQSIKQKYSCDALNQITVAIDVAPLPKLKIRKTIY